MHWGNCTVNGSNELTSTQALSLIQQKGFLAQGQFITAPHSTMEKMLLTHSVSGTEGQNVHLWACVWLWKECLCAHTRVRRGSISHQGQLCCGTAPELQQSCSSRQPVHGQTTLCPCQKQHVGEDLSEKKFSRDMNTIKSLKKVELGKQKWNTKLHREGKSKQLAAIVKTPDRNFQGANGNQPQRTASKDKVSAEDTECMRQ